MKSTIRAIVFGKSRGLIVAVAATAITPEGTNPRVLFFTAGDFGRRSWQGVP
jgi:hypothetical protein